MKKKTKIGFTIVIMIAVLFVAAAFSGFFNPSENKDENSSESYELLTTEDTAVLEWIEKNLKKDTCIIASDHRLERSIEAKGFRTTQTTQNETYFLWASENLTEGIDELFGIGNDYSNITHVLIDDIMINNVLHFGFRTEGINISYESYDKFSLPVFELVHRVETIEMNLDTGEPVHWVEVYKVNLTYFI